MREIMIQLNLIFRYSIHQENSGFMNKKIYITDPPPSTQIIFLADALKQVFDCQIIFLVSSLASRVYIPSRFSIRKINQLEDLKGEERLSFLDETLFCIMYNDLRSINKENKAFFIKHDLPCLFIERGFFRGVFCQADWVGCNVRSSFAKGDQGSFEYSEQELDDIFQIKRNESAIKRKFNNLICHLTFAVFLVSASIENLLLASMVRQRMGPLGYIKQFFKSLFPRRQWEFKNIRRDLTSITLFLQLETDTQFQNNGLYTTNEQLVSDFINLAHNKKFNPIVVPHPNDVSCLEYMQTMELAPRKFVPKDTGGFVALNSTAIFEKYLKGGSCCTLLKTWYSDAFNVSVCSTLASSVDYLLWDQTLERRAELSIEEFDPVLFSGSLPGDLLDRNRELAFFAAHVLKKSLIARNEKVID